MTQIRLLLSRSTATGRSSSTPGPLVSPSETRGWKLMLHCRQDTALPGTTRLWPEEPTAPLTARSTSAYPDRWAGTAIAAFRGLATVRITGRQRVDSLGRATA